MKVLPLRLHTGDDLRQALETWMGEQQEQAGCVISAIGSLSVAELVLGLLPEWRFSRELDPATGYAELRISPRVPRWGAADAAPPAGTPTRPRQH